MTALLAVNVPRPLDNFPLLRSASVKEVREAFARIYAEPTLVVKPRAESLNAVMNNCRLQCVELAFGAFGTEVRLDFPASGYVAQLFPLRGKAEIACGTTSIEVAAGSGCLLSSDAPHRLNFSADYAHLVLRVDARVLAEKLRSMIGAPLDQPLRIDTQSNPTRSCRADAATLSASSDRDGQSERSAFSRRMDRTNRAASPHSSSLWLSTQLQSRPGAVGIGCGAAGSSACRAIYRGELGTADYLGATGRGCRHTYIWLVQRFQEVSRLFAAHVSFAGPVERREPAEMKRNQPLERFMLVRAYEPDQLRAAHRRG